MTRPAVRSGLILLNLKMPKIDGKETLESIKSGRDLRRIPIVILTTSNSAWDITNTCDLGVSLFICKPVRFDQLIESTRATGNYWFCTVALPLH